MVRTLQIACLLALLSAFACAQGAPDKPAITFTLDFPGSQPERYSVEIHDDGQAHYQSSGKVSDESEEADTFSLDFSVSPENKDKIFDLAARAKYFQRDLDSHRKNMAFTGKKTLTYKDGQRNGESTYNFSLDVSVQELTNLFQGLSSTLETGHRLEYDYRYQKLALEQELKRAEEMARTGSPMELQAIAPILQQIVADTSVMNVSRARAQRLLVRAGKPLSAGPAGAGK
jgi:hypothetical protein